MLSALHIDPGWAVAIGFFLVIIARVVTFKKDE
jgi:preprotein translocase subunit Sec61beta